MKEIDLSLDDREFGSLNGLSTANAAVEICRTYFRRQNPMVTFPPSPNRADLHVQFPDRPGFDIEVKGTKEQGIAWQLLRASGQHSHDMLIRGLPLYRVNNVGSHNVTIFILKYKKDFEMKPEPRWTIYPVGSKS